MKILFVMNGNSYGGTEQQLLNLIGSLVAKEINCTVITEQKLLIKKLRSLKVSTHYVSFNDPNNLVESIKKFSCISDIVHAHRWDAIYWSAIALKDTATPLVCTIHSLFDLDYHDKEKQNRMKKKLDALLSRASCTIAVSEAVKTTLIKNGHDNNELHVIYNGVTGNLIDEFATTYSDSNDKTMNITIGFLGRLHLEKGPDQLVEALYLLNQEKNLSIQFNAVFVGDGPMKEELERKVDEYKLSDKIVFSGFVEDPEKVMANFTVLVVPSRREGMGLVIPEAMHCRVAVIGTKVGGIPEIITHNVNGILVEPESPYELKEAIKTLTVSRKLKEKLIAEGYKTWLKRFNSNVCADNHLNLYDQVLKRSTFEKEVK